ncbi:hypothetical protein I552_5364 [Mycobacterium xenopi 3993]|nr:hypothetical protein I552_5364 [Mycobacterium xenopi 3993]
MARPSTHSPRATRPRPPPRRTPGRHPHRHRRRRGRGRDKAAAGQPLNHDAPPSITELHRRAVEQIDPATFDEDNVRASGLQQARLNAEQAALKQLVAEGN